MKMLISNEKRINRNNPTPKNQKGFGDGVYIIGAGNMGGAMAKVLAKHGQKVFVYDRNLAKVKTLGNKNIYLDKNFANLAKADFVVLAVKPFQLKDLAEQIKNLVKPSAILCSILAGVKIARIQTVFDRKKVVRVMPNLGLVVGESIAGWTSAGLSNIEKQRVKKILNAITENFEVQHEQQIDSITAISGSGPAYFFYLAEALQKSAESLGFNTKTARKLVEKTFRASAHLQSGADYQTLINQVASKKGTTEEALKVFQKFNFNKIIKLTVQAAQKRAREISNE